jgi:murein DD-endopeptidase MepM/ murein hydrolase activator NlpD
MVAALRRVKPGWIVLLAVLAYAAVVTAVARDARAEARELRLQLAVAAPPPTAAQEDDDPVPPVARDGLWFPVPGAGLPADDAHLPGAPRSYRDGVSQGFAFYAGEAGVPIVLGTPVVAATDATVVRLDASYREPSQAEWEALLAEVAAGADEAQLDRLRGRQVWLEDDQGRTYRYAHLASIEPDLRVGQRVARGQVIARAGNSGTDDGVQGGRGGVRLHFEIWEDGAFLGDGLEPAAVRAEAAARFVGP